MRTVFLALGLFIASTLPALAASPHNTYTHNTAFAVPEQSYQLAATWFLPDWQAGLVSRTDTAPAGSGDRHDLTCSVYGGCLGIPANTTCSDDFTVDGKTCYKSCSCKSGFVPVSSSDICKGCVNPCDTHTAVDAPYGCEKYFSDCSSKCEKAYADNCRNYSSKPAASSCANGCAQGKTYTDCSSKCSVGCKAKCDTGYHLSSDELSCVADGCPDGYEEGKTCGAGYKRLQSGQSGTTPCYKCEVIPCTAGSTSCSGATVAKENGYYSGENKCYTCQTCEQAGKKTCNGTCIAASECCGCTSSQKCVSGSCVAKTCADAGGPVCSAGQECQNGACVNNVPCTSPYSLEITSCSSPYKLVRQATNPACGYCENQCSGYQEASLVQCPDISYVNNIMQVSPDEPGMWTNMGSPAFGNLESCAYDTSYKKCILECDLIKEFIIGKGSLNDAINSSKGIWGSMFQTKCTAPDLSDLLGLIQRCENGTGGKHNKGDYLLYQDLQKVFNTEQNCKIPTPIPYSNCSYIGYLSCQNFQ